MVRTISRRTAILGGAATVGALLVGGGVVANAEGTAGTRAVGLPLIGPVGGAEIHVMSFNIRTAVDHGKRSWGARLPRIAKIVNAEQPTILGTQEGRLHQIGDLVGGLPGYDCVRTGREKDGTGETCAIFFRTDRLEKLDEGHRWLSTTPKVPGSISWGAKHPRMMTWVKFRDRNTGGVFVHVNTHLDNASVQAREKGARLVRRWLNKRDLPGVVTGDFNTGPDTAPYRIMIGGHFHDTWNYKSKRLTPTYKTANLWKPTPVQGKRRIDWIIGTRQATVQRTAINTWVTKRDNLASDHWPVQAVVVMAG